MMERYLHCICCHRLGLDPEIGSESGTGSGHCFGFDPDSGRRSVQWCYTDVGGLQYPFPAWLELIHRHIQTLEGGYQGSFPGHLERLGIFPYDHLLGPHRVQLKRAWWRPRCRYYSRLIWILTRQEARCWDSGRTLLLGERIQRQESLKRWHLGLLEHGCCWQGRW